MFKIRLIDGTNVIEKEISGEICKVGRSIYSDIIIKKPFVSNEHLIIINLFNQIFIIDKSVNGVFINGKRIESGVPIFVKSEDEVCISTNRLEIILIDNYLESKTSFYYNYLREGAKISDIIMIQNDDNNYLYYMSDGDFEENICPASIQCEEILKNGDIRILRCQHRRKIFMIVILSTSKYYNYCFKKIENSRKQPVNFLNFIFVVVFLILFCLLLGMLIYLTCENSSL